MIRRTPPEEMRRFLEAACEIYDKNPDLRDAIGSLVTRFHVMFLPRDADDDAATRADLIDIILSAGGSIPACAMPHDAPGKIP